MFDPLQFQSTAWLRLKKLVIKAGGNDEVVEYGLDLEAVNLTREETAQLDLLVPGSESANTHAGLSAEAKTKWKHKASTSPDIEGLALHVIDNKGNDLLTGAVILKAVELSASKKQVTSTYRFVAGGQTPDAASKLVRWLGKSVQVTCDNPEGRNPAQLDIRDADREEDIPPEAARRQRADA